MPLDVATWGGSGIGWEEEEERKSVVDVGVSKDICVTKKHVHRTLFFSFSFFCRLITNIDAPLEGFVHALTKSLIGLSTLIIEYRGFCVIYPFMSQIKNRVS